MGFCTCQRICKTFEKVSKFTNNRKRCTTCDYYIVTDKWACTCCKQKLKTRKYGDSIKEKERRKEKKLLEQKIRV